MGAHKGNKPWNVGLKGIKTNNKGVHPKKEFKKGHAPWNKGKKTGLVPKSAFKKEQKSWNYIDGRSLNQSWNRYGDDWDSIRCLIYHRDNYQCQICGKKMDKNNILCVHHKIPFLDSFDNSLGNLILLCQSCHRKEEVKIIKQKKIKNLW